jgi:hypothetical protein
MGLAWFYLCLAGKKLLNVCDVPSDVDVSSNALISITECFFHCKQEI